MDEPRAQRTLVKSPPELWAEVSDPGALAGHLGAFGDIRITRLEPESTVAWEGDRARGTVELEPAGWGTKVTLTARMEEPRTEDEAAPAAAPAPVTPAAPEPPEAGPHAATEPAEDAAPAPPRRGLLARLFGRRRRAPEAEPEPEPAASRASAAPEPAPEPPPEPVATAPVAAEG